MTRMMLIKQGLKHLIARNMVIGATALIRIPGAAPIYSNWLAWVRPRASSRNLTDLLIEEGHPELAIQVAESHVRYLHDQPEWMHHRTDHYRRLAGPKAAEVAISSEEKAAVLGDLVDLFEQRGWRPFLCFGGLLGKIREDDFMDHDNDLDIGFFYPETPCNAVRECLMAAGYSITVWDPDPWPCRIKACKSGSDLSIDIVFFKDDGRFRLTYSRYLSRTLVRKRQQFALKRTRLRGVTVWIPANAEEHLTENYGNWQQRSRYHHYILTSRLTDFSIPEVRYLLTITLVSALLRGQHVRSEALISIGLQHYHDGVWSHLHKHWQTGQ